MKKTLFKKDQPKSQYPLDPLENTHAKYAVPSADFEQGRDAAMEKLKGFPVELGYA